ncbi:YmaF family protein [Anaerocolumna sp. AGMB13020]|uniref:YmaF family protein n=1 Tax=Anaerocolumna sp. AGMB13020 TaxID=3081750 RepID=UPI002953B051|nr:YmaF family protein [Anaerocolumna sp. AGMB13020]WOO36473.1 YmaF family protein [Anaerocolumna sp. AGMB13020]
MHYIKLRMNSNDSQYKNHVHEVQGYVKMAEDKHYHKFSFVTGEAVFTGNGEHYHEIAFHTDNAEGHFHTFEGKTYRAVPMGDRHVHYLEGDTSNENGHRHGFRLVTLMNNPTDIL